jgi:hypothetical protein
MLRYLLVSGSVMECRHWGYVIHMGVIPYVDKSNPGPNRPLQSDGTWMCVITCWFLAPSLSAVTGVCHPYGCNTVVVLVFLYYGAPRCHFFVGLYLIRTSYLPVRYLSCFLPDFFFIIRLQKLMA